MNIQLRNGQKSAIVPYTPSHFKEIHSLNEKEEWSNLVAKHINTREAWDHSTIAYVVINEKRELIGYVRGLTDTKITLYICEILIDKRYRGLGVGKILIDYVHSLYPETRMEMLASSESRTYYEQKSWFVLRF
ncbi:GCN5 family acetyltransferase [Bacillus coahuilensis m2-6]|uniref:GNAT family N-acetyltransferase n=1 Tax=Bacillus coahuilensis TaxID=408580 RepID=UPI0001850DAE|nr:GNAT family N-acetyltransferase [Bacillus coahuilensis]KUP08339.1 GCN5 family acetyltransferase [Bacillus coahuilensis m2-6]